MGFDNECIVNIQSLAGEYFCPVCRFLVYPNEALQSQCTHLYCKPCLTYIVGTTRACPYDGYLVTEADSKPLIESNKALAETIGKIAVHCLYHRSGCQWQGSLSECTSHCSGCAFGNSPVVCNRCGVQIVHREVHDHAQTCPGVQPQAQLAEATKATATSSTAEQTQSANQPGPSNSQAQPAQTMVAPPTGQVPNAQAVANSQALGAVPVVVPTAEQIYQQQFQQYYQQYPGYDPYQQAYQNYYPQLAVQQYQQHLPGQHQSQMYSQPPNQTPIPAQTPIQSQPQVQPLSHPPPQTQPPHAQLQPHTQPQPIQHVQAPVAAQVSVNPQHQLHPAVQQPTQMPSQAHPPPHGHPQPQPYPGAGAQPHLQPHPSMPLQMSMPQHQQQPQIQLPPQHQSVPQLLPQSHLQPQPQAQLPHPHPQLQAPPQMGHPPSVNAQPPTQHPHAQMVTGNHSYPQHQAHQQMQLGAQHPPQINVQSAPISQHHVQMPGQFPQQPPPRPHQSLPPVPNQQRPVMLPPQGQVLNVPSVQQQPIHAHQTGHPGQRPPMQPMQQPLPQQHQQAFPVQTSAPVLNQLHPHGQLVQQQQFMQSQLRPQGPPQLMQQNVAQSHGLPPQQSQNYAARPMMANGTQSQPFPQTSGFAGVGQVRPMQFTANQPVTNQNYPPRTSNHLFSEQHVQSGLALKPTGVERQGDHMPGGIVADKNGSPSYRTAEKEPNGLVPASGLGVTSFEAKSLKSETDVQKPTGGDEHGNIQVDVHGKDSLSDLHPAGTASAEPATKHLLKAEADKSSPGGRSVEIVATEHQDAVEGPQRGKHSTADDTSLQHTEASKDQSGKLPKDAGMLVSGGATKGSKASPLAAAHIPDGSAKSQTSITGGDRVQHGLMHPFPLTDQHRHQNMGMPYGPSTQQAALLPGPPGPPHHAQVLGQPLNTLRPQGPGHLPQPGQPLNPSDHFQSSVLKQPHGAFHHEFTSGRIPGPSSAAYGQGSSHFGPPERSFEQHPVAPQGPYNHGHVPPLHAGLPRMSEGEPPGSFNSHGGIMGRAPPHGLEGKIGQPRPINPVESENFSKQRSNDSHLVGSFERAPFGQSSGVEPNVMRIKEGTSNDSSSAVGFRGERFKRLTEEGLRHVPMEPAWRGDRSEFEEDLKQFPRHPHFGTETPSKFGSFPSSSRRSDKEPLDHAPHGLNYDAGLKLDPGAVPRFFPPYHPGSSNDARPVGPDGNIGRADSAHAYPDFLGPGPGFGRHHMDRSTPRSPGREYHGFPTRDFGGLSRFPRNQSGLDDMEGPRPFGGGPRTLNFPSDPVGNSFNESRFPHLPGHLRRGELDVPGNLHSSDLIGQDISHGHFRRDEFLGTRNLPSHLRFGEPVGFGGFPGHSHMGDLAGPGNFPHHRPFGEPFGGNKSGHPRLGEPGFRSSYSVTGGKDPFDNSRKRTSSSMGWCRICKVDCETVEGLDLHSQTREHQKMAMDMVVTIKQQNMKKLKTSNDQSTVEEPSKSRGSGYEVLGNKP